MQLGVLFYHFSPNDIAIVGHPNDPATPALIATVYRDYLPTKVVALATPQTAANPNARANSHTKDAKKAPTKSKNPPAKTENSQDGAEPSTP